LHELEIGNQPLLAREQEGGDGGISEQCKIRDVHLLGASQAHALIPRIKMLKAQTNLAFLHLNDIKFLRKIS